MAGYSGKSLVQKLGIKPGFCIFVDGLSVPYRDVVGELPDGVQIAEAVEARLDMVHIFAAEAKGLAARLRSYRKAIAPHDALPPMIAALAMTMWMQLRPQFSSRAPDAAQRSAAPLRRGALQSRGPSFRDLACGFLGPVPAQQRSRVAARPGHGSDARLTLSRRCAPETAAHHRRTAPDPAKTRSG
ncbi:DUF3052 domain-containing protein [Bradyrhizobium sp. CCBAU 51627]|uniref:DUF3052 domain-containing protein n=1 Tax=Bradyrhizobium sp. CCBAU 51627 TaxID=1325088 RepID=UPI002305DECA|nr:DUF3052 domain-containing protein [Bradyrhizobium sp. CCBAU 51627]